MKLIMGELIMSGKRGNGNPGENPEFGVLEDVRTEEPKLYKVVIMNDDYTPMDFVVYVLKSFFNHDDVSAQKIMLDVHKKGAGLAGVYSFEIAETKSYQANQFSKQNKYPLKTTIEEES